MTVPFVTIVSPCRGEFERNRLYLSRAIKDCISRHEAPFATHLYAFSGALNDNIVSERYDGMFYGNLWAIKASYFAVYEDYGITEGMKADIHLAESLSIIIHYRSIGINP